MIPSAPDFKFHVNHAFGGLALLAMLIAPCAQAQVPSSSRMFLEVGEVALVDEIGFATGGLRWCSVAPMRPSVDFAFTFALVAGIIGASELDLALPVPLAPGVSVIPRAGVSAYVVSGAGGALGFNYGAGVVLNPNGPVLLRADVCEHGLGTGGPGRPTVLTSISAGIGWRY
jgi:hypothetical protein